MSFYTLFLYGYIVSNKEPGALKQGSQFHKLGSGRHDHVFGSWNPEPNATDFSNLGRGLHARFNNPP